MLGGIVTFGASVWTGRGGPHLQEASSWGAWVDGPAAPRRPVCHRSATTTTTLVWRLPGLALNCAVSSLGTVVDHLGTLLGQRLTARNLALSIMRETVAVAWPRASHWSPLGTARLSWLANPDGGDRPSHWARHFSSWWSASTDDYAPACCAPRAGLPRRSTSSTAGHQRGARRGVPTPSPRRGRGRP